MEGTEGVPPCVNPLNVELNPIRHLLALVGARHIVHVSRIRVNPLNAALNPNRHLLALVGARHVVHVSRIRVKVLMTSCVFPFIFSGSSNATVNEGFRLIIICVSPLDCTKRDRSVDAAAVFFNYSSRPFENALKTAYF